jgi:WD40 repeat protein
MKEPPPGHEPKNKRIVLIHQLILGAVIVAIIAIAVAAIFVVRSQGITQGLITLTIISIIVSTVIGLLTLMINSFQWLSSKEIPAHKLSVPPHQSEQVTPHENSQQLQLSTIKHMHGSTIESLEHSVPTHTKQGQQEAMHKEDWVEAPHVPNFYGREKECTILEQWIIDDHCKLVALFGIGGIGKSSLAATLTEQIKDAFEYVFWRSLQNAPPLESILKSCIQFLSNYQGIELPEEIDSQIALLIQYLRDHRCLFILDNVETILEAGSSTGRFREGYETYGRLIRRIGEAKHQSCLLLTSREKLKEIAQLEGRSSPVRSIELPGLEQQDGQELLRDKGLFGSEETLAAMIRLYSGNPLSLKLVSEPIHTVFGGDVASFLKQGRTVLGDIRDPLDLQFTRLSELEREVIYWLAIEREAVPLDVLRSDMIDPVSNEELVVAIASLRRRSMIESTGAALFTLQPVIIEYVTDRIVEQVFLEIDNETLKLFASLALIKAQTKDYVRDTQVRLILSPIAERLLNKQERNEIENKFKNILSTLRKMQPQKSGYAAGNALNLLLHFKSDLRGYDFSYLPVWQAYLQGTQLFDVNFSHANLATSVFTEPFAGILSVVISPNGERLAAGTTYGEIRQWQVKNGVALPTCRGHIGWIYSISASSDGKLLASGGEDQIVRLWDVNTGQCLKTLQGHTNRIWSVAFSPNSQVLISGSHDQTVRLWEVSTGQCLKTLQGHTNRIWSVAFSPDGETIASGSEDQTVRLWDTYFGQCTKMLEGHTSLMKSVAFSPDGKLLASGSDDQTVRLWEVSTGQCLEILRDHTNRVRSVTFSPDGKLLASGSDDQTVRLWEVSTGQCLKTLQEHTYWVGSVAFSPDGKLLASGSEDQTVRLWEVDSGQCLKTLHGYAHLVESVAYHPDGTLLASGSDDRVVRLWDVSTGKCVRTLYGHNGSIRSIAISTDGKTLASGSDDQTVRLWEVSTGESLRTLCGHTSRVWSVAFSPDGKMLASASEDQTVLLCEVNTGRSLTTLHGHTNWIWSVTFSPDGETLASGSGDQTVRLWNVSTGDCLTTLRGHKSYVWSVAFSPDGKCLASGSEDQTIYLWEVSTGRNLAVLNGHTGIVRSVVFDPNGKLLASCSDDQTIRLWDISTGHNVAILSGHTNQVRSVAFSPATGRLLASSSHDGTIKMWDIETYQCLNTLQSDRPYERMNITDIKGLTDTQKAMLKALGAIEDKR